MQRKNAKASAKDFFDANAKNFIKFGKAFISNLTDEELISELAHKDLADLFPQADFSSLTNVRTQSRLSAARFGIREICEKIPALITAQPTSTALTRLNTRLSGLNGRFSEYKKTAQKDFSLCAEFITQRLLVELLSGVVRVKNFVCLVRIRLAEELLVERLNIGVLV